MITEKNSGSKFLQIFSHLEHAWQVHWVLQISAILVFLIYIWGKIFYYRDLLESIKV